MTTAPNEDLRQQKREMAELRRRYRAALRDEAVATHGRAHALRIAAKFPLRALRESSLAVSAFGAAVSRSYGVSRARQLVEQVALRLRYGIRPDAYYQLRLFRPDRRAQAWAYVDRHYHYTLVYKPLRRRWSDDYDVIDDKHRFARQFIERGFPCAGTLVRVHAGRAEWAVANLPPCDLFSKPSGGRGGFGSYLWLHEPGEDGTDRWRDEAGHYTRESVTADELIALLLDGAAREPHLLQRRIVNHPTLAPLTSSGLSTTRIITIRQSSGEIVVFRAVQRIPAGRAVVDNLSNGGLAAPIDLATGQLGPAARMSPAEAIAFADCHPDNGAMIVGRALPHWDEARSMTVRAHAELATLSIIGWDVALTADGPVFIEGNASPGALLSQMPSGVPLGGTEYIRRMLEIASADGGA